MLFKSDLIYPYNKDFIFTIVDDTDVSTLDSVKPIYDFLYSLGIYTTKTVWPLDCKNINSDYIGSDTLEVQDYKEYIISLAQKGFEIGFHGASMESSLRERTKDGLNYFYESLGYFPNIYACHAGNKENMYWGENRFSNKVLKKLYKLIVFDRTDYQGDKKESPYFWGDMCSNHIKFIRSFTYNTINLLNIRFPVYKNPIHPYSNYYFITADTDNILDFNRILCKENQDLLEEQRGICILTTHFGKGFVKKGVLNIETQRLLNRLSKRNGWFAPVSNVLDYLISLKKELHIKRQSLFYIELLWFIHAIKRRFQIKVYEKTELEYLSAIR